MINSISISINQLKDRLGYVGIGRNASDITCASDLVDVIRLALSKFWAPKDIVKLGFAKLILHGGVMTSSVVFVKIQTNAEIYDKLAPDQSQTVPTPFPNQFRMPEACSERHAKGSRPASRHLHQERGAKGRRPASSHLHRERGTGLPLLEHALPLKFPEASQGSTSSS